MKIKTQGQERWLSTSKHIVLLLQRTLLVALPQSNSGHPSVTATPRHLLPSSSLPGHQALTWARAHTCRPTLVHLLFYYEYILKHAFLNWDLKHEKECIINNFWIPLKQQPYFNINLIGLNWVFGMLESKLFSEFNRLHDLLGSASHCGRFSLLLSLRQWEGRETEGSPTVSFTEALKTSAWLADPFPCI